MANKYQTLTPKPSTPNSIGSRSDAATPMSGISGQRDKPFESLSIVGKFTETSRKRLARIEDDLASFRKTEERFKQKNHHEPSSISYIYLTHKDSPDAIDDGINQQWFDKNILEQLIEEVVIDDEDQVGTLWLK